MIFGKDRGLTLKPFNRVLTPVEKSVYLLFG
jgi:hypothetical protein